MSKTARTYSPPTLDAARILGLQIARARRERRWTIEELAERIGVSKVTARSVELGKPTVAVGVVFEAATIVGLRLFDQDPDGLRDLVQRSSEQLALLPARVRPTQRPVDDDF